MRNRREEPFVKIYKDLIISKRVLTDLRESITKTLCRLKQPPKQSLSNHNKKASCKNCGNFYNPAAPHDCKVSSNCCPICYLIFENQTQVAEHLKSNNHHYCSLCHEKFKENQTIHETQMCGFKRIKCERCGAKVKRKDINDHISTCCFHECPKCNKNVFYQGYSYHVGRCHNRMSNDPNMQETLKINGRSTWNCSKNNKYLPTSLWK